MCEEGASGPNVGQLLSEAMQAVAEGNKALVVANSEVLFKIISALGLRTATFGTLAKNGQRRFPLRSSRGTRVTLFDCCPSWVGSLRDG